LIDRRLRIRWRLRWLLILLLIRLDSQIGGTPHVGHHSKRQLDE
jgi:hypothetical protein